MGLNNLLQTYTWNRYSKKMIERIEKPRSAGYFTRGETEGRGVRFVEGREGFISDGNALCFYWLVDEADGQIVDAKFQAFGDSALIAAAEAACEILVGKNYDQAKRIGADLIDKQLRDHPDRPAFPEETASHINLVIDAIDDAIEKCFDIPLSNSYVTPLPRDFEGKEEGGYPGWLALSYEQKISVIEEVLNEEVRPYIELDAGGIEVLKLIDDKELLISYQGNCTSCFSSIGATLSTIQQIVRAKIHSDIIVVPNMDDLKFT